jgi:endonuclease/exonuclease/phosphatase family metal-dependent hydrolase
MSQPNSPSIGSQRLKLVLITILLLFFFQLLTDFVEAVYIFGLLGSSIPPEITMVLLFLSPLLLYAFGNRIHPRWVQVFAVIAILARAIEIFLSTRGRMIVGGIGVAAFLMYFPTLLAQSRISDEHRRFAREAGFGLTLAIFASIMFRALHSGSDISAFGMFRSLTLGLAVVALYLVFRLKADMTARTQDEPASTKMGRVHAYTFGLASGIIVLNFAFTAPNVIARWAGVSKLSVFGILLVAWISVGWWWMRQKSISSKLILWWGLAFAAMMLFTIIPHQIAFPQTQDVGYPLPAPQIALWQYIPLYLMLLLSPVLVLAFVSHLDGLFDEQPKFRQLAGSFGLAGFYILVMVFAQVFTTVYDYIPVIGPFFRDKFWLIFLVPSLGAILPVLFTLDAAQGAWEVFSPDIRRDWLIVVKVMSAVAVVGLMILTAHPTAPAASSSDMIRIFTYNIQQGYNNPGEQNFEDQIKLIRTNSPDILGLEECDTARIAGGNVDVVAYFADSLNMYSYYGPSPVTGTFGIALLSRYPIENPKTYFLYSKGEQVAVIEAEITIGGQTHKVYVTHLGNSGPIFQIRQMLDLMRGQDNVIAMGDFNFRPYEEQYSLATAEYDDAYIHAEQQKVPTSLDIEDRIDHVFVTPGTSVSYVEYLPKGESDHPALFVEIKR